MTTKDQLSLRLIGLSDYRVVCDGRDIGRIRLAHERPDMEQWDWRVNPPLPIPSWCNGSSPSLEAAKAAFRTAWEQFYETLTPSDIEHWHRSQDGARERAERLGWS